MLKDPVQASVAAVGRARPALGAVRQGSLASLLPSLKTHSACWALGPGHTLWALRPLAQPAAGASVSQVSGGEGRGGDKQGVEGLCRASPQVSQDTTGFKIFHVTDYFWAMFCL